MRAIRSVRCAPIALVACALVVVDARSEGVSRPTPACPDGPTEFAAVRDVESDLTVTVADGRTLRIVGLEPPRATAGAPGRPGALQAALMRQFAGQTVGFATLGAAGRWGAIPSVVFTENGRFDEILLAQGAVRVRPDPEARPCRAALLDAEERARRDGRGVWSDPALSPLNADADDFDSALAGAEGLTIVEGTVTSLGETGTRLYLNLGRARGRFAISLPKRDSALIGSHVVIRARTVGTRVRVRGLIDRHTSPRIDLSDADALEVLIPVRPSESPATR